MLRTFFWVWLAWSGIGFLHALSQYTDMVKYNAPMDKVWTNSALLILSYAQWIIITLVLLWFMKRLVFPFSYRSVIVLFVTGLFCWIPFYFALDAGISTIIEDQSFNDWVSKLLNFGGSTIFFYSVLYGFTFAVCLGVVLSEKTTHAQKINADLVQKQTESALLLSEQKMQLIQLQLSPHFLFNCMGAISGLARQHSRTILIQAIAKVGDLLRYTIENSSSKAITLDEELIFLHNYIELQQLRFEDRFICSFSIDDFNNDIMCPPFTLQLLLENVFRHAVELTEEQVHIDVSVRQNEHDVRVNVRNTHSSYSKESKSMGIGLDNLKARLTHLYGDNFVFEFNVTKTQFEVLLTLPKEQSPI